MWNPWDYCYCSKISLNFSYLMTSVLVFTESGCQQGSGGKCQPHTLLPSRLQRTMAPDFRGIWKSITFSALLQQKALPLPPPPNKEASKISQNLIESIVKYSGMKLSVKKTNCLNPFCVQTALSRFLKMGNQQNKKYVGRLWYWPLLQTGQANLLQQLS